MTLRPAQGDQRFAPGRATTPVQVGTGEMTMNSGKAIRPWFGVNIEFTVFVEFVGGDPAGHGETVACILYNQVLSSKLGY